MFKKVRTSDGPAHTFKRQSSSSHLPCSCQNIGCEGSYCCSNPIQRLSFCIFFFEYKMCVFTQPTKNSNGVMSGFLVAKRLALSFRYTRFGIKSLRLNGRGRCYTTGGARCLAERKVL